MKHRTFLFAFCSIFAFAGWTSCSPRHAEPQPSASDMAGTWQPVIEAYRSYVVQECDAFVKETEAFVQAFKAGDAETAKKLYAPARMHYERIEPIAEALGDFDPRIDARENDVPEQEWGGFHRLEKALWTEGRTSGAELYADRLLQDVKQLRVKVESVEFEPAILVTGAVELLNEISSGKITGEEERYSHTDLYDIAANIEGAEQIFRLLRPVIDRQDKPLAEQIAQRFDEVWKLLEQKRSGDGYVPFTSLSEEETKALSRAVDALAEPLSQIGSILEES